MKPEQPQSGPLSEELQRLFCRWGCSQSDAALLLFSPGPDVSQSLMAEVGHDECVRKGFGNAARDLQRILRSCRMYNLMIGLSRATPEHKGPAVTSS